jgi:hypothetical protein
VEIGANRAGVAAETSAERETAYLLGSETMKSRLLAAKARTGGIAFEAAVGKLGL